MISYHTHRSWCGHPRRENVRSARHGALTAPLQSNRAARVDQRYRRGCWVEKCCVGPRAGARPGLLHAGCKGCPQAYSFINLDMIPRRVHVKSTRAEQEERTRSGDRNSHRTEQKRRHEGLSAYHSENSVPIILHLHNLDLDG